MTTKLFSPRDTSLYPMEVLEVRAEREKDLAKGDVIFVLRTRNDKKIAIKAPISGQLVSPLFDIGATIYQPMIIGEIEKNGEGAKARSEAAFEAESVASTPDFSNEPPFVSSTRPSSKSRFSPAALAVSACIVIGAAIYWASLTIPSGSLKAKSLPSSKAATVSDAKFSKYADGYSTNFGLVWAEKRADQLYDQLIYTSKLNTSRVSKLKKEISDILAANPHIEIPGTEQDPSSAICKLIDKMNNMDQVITHFSGDEKSFYSQMETGKCYFSAYDSTAKSAKLFGPVSPVSKLFSRGPGWVSKFNRHLRKQDRFDVFADVVMSSTQYEENVFDSALGILSLDISYVSGMKKPDWYFSEIQRNIGTVCRMMPKKEKGVPFKTGLLTNPDDFRDPRFVPLYNEYCIRRMLGSKLAEPEKVYGPVWAAITATPESLGSGRNRDRSAVKKLIASGADVNLPANVYKLPGGLDSPLIKALRSENAELALDLIKAGADPNWVGKRGHTALGLAIQNTNDARVVKALIAAGADVSVMSPQDVAKLEGFSFKAHNWKFWTNIDAALFKGNVEIVDVLWDQADTSDAAHLVLQTLEQVAYDDNFAVLDYIRNRGINIDATTPNSLSLFEKIARFIPTEKGIDGLISRGVDIQRYSKEHGSILYRLSNDKKTFHYVVSKDNQIRQERIRFLKSRGLKIIPPGK